MLVTIADPVNGVTLTVESVRKLLDSPSNGFLSEDGITLMLNRSYNWVVNKIDVTEFSGQSIADAIYAFTVWQSYMIYLESVSEYLKEQNPKMVVERADDFRKVAMLYLEAIGIKWPLDKDGIMNVKDINVQYGYCNASMSVTLSEVYDRT